VCEKVCEENKMVSTPSISYQPAVALQGEPQRNNNTAAQEPKENQVQPQQAAPADSQSSDETSSGDRSYAENTAASNTSDNSSDGSGKGSQLDVTV
jgi:hypothetical protein